MHDCSMCGCACYCHGDIDDCQVETVEYAYMHCDGCGCSEDEFYDEQEEADNQDIHDSYDNSAEEYEMWLMMKRDLHDWRAT